MYNGGSVSATPVSGAKIGIGTSSPNSILEVSASNNGTTLTTFGDPTISITNRSTTNNTFGSLAFQTQSTNGASSTAARISGITTSHTNGAVSGALAFLTQNAGTLGEVGRFTATGNFGVGTTTPFWALTAASSTGPQLALVDTTASSFAWTFRNTGNTLYVASSTASATSTTPALTISPNGLVGIGTSTPATKLEVGGDITDDNVLNCATLITDTNGKIKCTSSDERLKQDITPLDASSSLAAIEQLNPVSFYWRDPSGGTQEQLGFIAQDVQQIFPELVSTSTPTALTPDGTLTFDYLGLISPIVSAIQVLSTEVQNLVATVQGFAQKFTTNQLCVNKSDGTPVCVTGDQLAALLASQGSGSNQPPSGAQQSPSGGSNPPESVTQNSASTTPTTPPTITINGANPAIIEVGDSYADLGATVSDTGPGQAGATNLGVTTFLNGTLVSNIVIDTSQVATDTIDYVATDQNGLTATSTRTVLIEAAASSVAAATTTDATTTQ
jgi:hypothetical protein